jgi:cobalt/nickel transport system permease protein
MHIPDGFLDTKTIVATTTLSVVGIAAAWRQTKNHIQPERIPLLGVAAAFVFAAQMLNFPVAGGTSGHLMGAALSTVLLGPAAAIVVMSCVLVVQCFLFADGGVLALGANIFNMAILGSIVGDVLYRSIYRMIGGERGRVVAVAVASWCSVVLASICCAGELAWSGTVSWQAAFPAMAGIHAVIGVGEAAITCLIIVAIRKARPELLIQPSGDVQSRSYSSVVAYGVVIAIGLALFVSPFAYKWPDGLEMVAAKLGFDSKVIQHPLAQGPIPDYQFPGVHSMTLATIAGGVIGVGMVFLLVYVLSRMLKTKHDKPINPIK